MNRGLATERGGEGLNEVGLDVDASTLDRLTAVAQERGVTVEAAAAQLLRSRLRPRRQFSLVPRRD